MRRIVALEYLSIDGVMEDPAWTVPFWNDKHAKYAYGTLFSSDALLLGRRTYEGFAAAWPTMSDPQGFADRMNSLPKYVVSTTLDTAEWTNSHVVKGDVAAEVARLKEEPGKDILVYGSADLVNWLVGQGLLDEMRLWIHPVVVGTGKRLFPEENTMRTWDLVGTAVLDSGAVVLDYRPRGEEQQDTASA
jgi:dihydrofolate reductase